jgi:DNA polymerase-4
MERILIHADQDCFYASVEILHHPLLRGKPVAVAGDPEARHGIILTKSYEAKRCGVKTAMAIWEAKQVCPDLIVLPPNYPLYLRFSQMFRELLSEYVRAPRTCCKETVHEALDRCPGVSGNACGAILL